MTMRIAVLGGNGQVGSVIVRELARDRSLNVVAVCRNAVGAAQVETAGCDIRLGSVGDARTAAGLLGDCDVIINTVWAAGAARAARAEHEAILRGLASLRGRKKVVLFSSVAVHGYCIDAARSTFERPQPDSPYGRQKLALEKTARDLFRNSEAALFIVRLGHVYGAHQWVSQEIVTLLENGGFQLPYSGRRASNAVEAAEVAAAMRALASGDLAAGTYNLTSNPQRTWRELFDSHARICDLPPARDLDDAASDALRSAYLRVARRSSVSAGVHAVTKWLRSLPFGAFVTSNEMRALLSPAVSIVPGPLQSQLKAHAAVVAVRAQINAASQQRPQPSPWHYSDAMPGPHLQSAMDAGTQQRAERDLAEWYRLRSFPPQFS